MQKGKVATVLSHVFQEGEATGEESAEGTEGEADAEGEDEEEEEETKTSEETTDSPRLVPGLAMERYLMHLVESVW